VSATPCCGTASRVETGREVRMRT